MRPGAGVGSGVSVTDAAERSTGAVGGSDGGLSGSGGISVIGATVAESAGDGGVEVSDSLGVADAPEDGGERFLGWFLRRDMGDL
jgi:hypothetical protein